MKPAWLALLAATLLIVGAADAVLLEAGAGYFRTGYNGPLLASWSDRASFLALAACIDLALVLGIWTPLCSVLRRTRLGGTQQAVLAFSLGAGIPLTLDVIRYRIHRVLGDVLDLRVLWELSGAKVSGSVAEMVSQAPGTAAMTVGAIGGVALLVGIAGRAQRRGLQLPGAPRGRVLFLAFLGALVPAGSLLAFVEMQAPRFAYGLARKPSANLLHGLIERATDLDRDGSGLLARPRDPAPLDPMRHPWALDLPGNGIDENGFAGDHPADFALAEPPAPPAPSKRGPRPHLLLVYLESFRGDLVGARHGEREVTPFLSRLGEEGASTEHAYVHTPYTGPSREQLFSGSLSYVPGQPTLYDDFRERGYRIAHFSGQDDTHAEAVHRLRLDEADVFYDARQDIERKTSRTTASVSLQVSWKTLLERVEAFLEGYEDDRPLLLYVNIVDAHFPYYHRELDDLLGVGPLARSEIHGANAEGVRAAYRNAAANVDRAVEQLTRAWWDRMGDRAPVLVTGDHGQSFYEHGMLGHGQSLRPDQTRVPFVLWGIGGRWPEPLGLAEVRPYLLQALFLQSPGEGDVLPRARFQPDPRRELFLYLADLERPRLLATRRLQELVVLDLASGATRRYVDDVEAPSSEKSEQIRRRMLLTWEGLRLQEAGKQKPR